MSLDINEYKEFELDIKATLISNIINIFWFGVLILFIILTINLIETWDKNSQIIGLIVFIFAILKMLGSGFTRINYEYKYIKEKDDKEKK